MPGFIETPMIATVPKNIMEKVEAKIPLRRRGTPDEVAEVSSTSFPEAQTFLNFTFLVFLEFLLQKVTDDV